MTTAGRAYVVRDADGGSGEVTKVYAYTLKGLTTALEDARFRSFHGAPQAVVVMRDGQSSVIRRFEQGREVPLPPLPRLRPSFSPGPRLPRLRRARRYPTRVFLAMFAWLPRDHEGFLHLFDSNPSPGINPS